jgi:uncharacterized protein
VSVQPTPRPTADDERIQLLDQLRGLALFGILLVNMIFMAQPVVVVLRDQVPVSDLDRAARAFIDLFAEGKFISTFSLLFGIGFYILSQRFESRERPFKRVAVRRYVMLLVFGIAHGTLLWPGDILCTYALLAFLLLPFRKRKPRTLLIWIAAIGCLLAILLTVGAIVASMSGDSTTSAKDAQEVAARIAQAMEAYSSPSFIEVTAQRAKDFLLLLLLDAQASPMILSMFLWGLYLGKQGWLADPAAHARQLRRLLVVGLVVGVPTALFHAIHGLLRAGTFHISAMTVLDGLATLVSGMALALAYVSAIALASRDARWRSRLAFLAPVGRMALSNYLAQALIASLIFYGYGLGLIGQVSHAVGLLITVAIFALQILWSRWWFRHFRFGPLEWLWRAATYLTLPPMRLRSR